MGENPNHCCWFCAEKQKQTFPQRDPITSMPLSPLIKLKALQAIYKAGDSSHCLSVVCLPGAFRLSMNASVHFISRLHPQQFQQSGWKSYYEQPNLELFGFIVFFGHMDVGVQ